MCVITREEIYKKHHDNHSKALRLGRERAIKNPEDHMNKVTIFTPVRFFFRWVCSLFEKKYKIDPRRAEIYKNHHERTMMDIQEQYDNFETGNW